MKEEHLIIHDGELIYIENFIPQKRVEHYRKLLVKEIEWQQDKIKLFGKIIDCPRLTQLYGDPGISYRYSGITKSTLPWTISLLAIKVAVEDYLQTSFNSVLVNRYLDQSHSMGWHADNEKSLGKNPLIASVSLGATRRIDFKHNTKKEKVSWNLTAGSLLIMKGGIQENWKHQVPKSSLNCEERINLTFRTIITN